MRIESLRSFVTLVRSGSYAKTAEELFMSATTVHGQIRALEQEMGTALLTFQARELHLTAAGSRLLRFAEQTLAERAILDDDVSGISRRDPARLRISSLHGPSIHILPPAVRAYREVHDDVLISISTSDIGGGIASLSSGQVDILIFNDLHIGELPPGHAVTNVYDDTLSLIIRAEDYCPPEIALLAKFPIASQAQTSAYRRYVEQWARTAGITIDVAFEHSSFDGLLSYVLQGGCVGMVSGYVAKMSPMADRFRVLSLPEFSLQRRVVAAHAIRPAPLAADFLEFLHDYHARKPA